MRNNKINDCEAVSTSATFGKRFKTRRPIPKRGQIKRKIAAKAFQTLVSVIAAAPPPPPNATL